ncbi:MAG: TIM barrel protein [Actinomycetota bacterium]|nr:TIM barrel protein [Actinomycetota bacterium]
MNPDLERDETRAFPVGSAPDSWGVWFPDDPLQTPWPRFLDEVAAAEYDWIELGPFGYLPTDPRELQAELDKRGLRLSGGTVGGALHRPEELPAVRRSMLEVAALAGALGAKHLVFLPSMYRGLKDGAQLERADLDAEQWRALTNGAEHLAKVLLEETGMRFCFHPHAESHVETCEQIERFLADTDPELVGLCLDTGHVAYAHGDAPRIAREHPDRIWYVHIKSVDPEVLARVNADRLPFADAVKLGVMCEPSRGIPPLDEMRDAISKLPAGTFVVVEQDLYPCDFGRPLPIALRTRKTLRDTGIG